MNIPKAVLVFVLAIGLGSLGASSFGDEKRRDGNWWLEQPPGSKLDYLIGFLDGVALGRNFSTWGIMDKDKRDPAIGKAVNSYSSYVDQYLTNVTVGQMDKGLADFYADYRNLRIHVSDAIWPVLRGISGAPKEQVEGLIENLRKNAAHN